MELLYMEAWQREASPPKNKIWHSKCPAHRARTICRDDTLQPELQEVFESNNYLLSTSKHPDKWNVKSICRIHTVLARRPSNSP